MQNIPKMSENKTEEEEFYEVEKILKKRIRNGNVEYLIKWEVRIRRDKII